MDGDLFAGRKNESHIGLEGYVHVQPHKTDEPWNGVCRRNTSRLHLVIPVFPHNMCCFDMCISHFSYNFIQCKITNSNSYLVVTHKDSTDFVGRRQLVVISVFAHIRV